MHWTCHLKVYVAEYEICFKFLEILLRQVKKTVTLRVEKYVYGGSHEILLS